jgi:hypothetical protein
MQAETPTSLYWQKKLLPPDASQSPGEVPAAPRQQIKKHSTGIAAALSVSARARTRLRAPGKSETMYLILHFCLFC